MSGTPWQGALSTHPRQFLPPDCSQTLTQGFLSHGLALPHKFWRPLLLQCQILLINKYCKALCLSPILRQQLAQVSLFILENNTFPKGNTANISDCWGLGHGKDTELTFPLSASPGIAVLLNPIPPPSLSLDIPFRLLLLSSRLSTFFSPKPGFSLILIPFLNSFIKDKTKQLQANFVFPGKGNSQSTRGHQHSSGVLFMDSKI